MDTKPASAAKPTGRTPSAQTGETMKEGLLKATKRALLGRTITGVDFGPFDDGRGGTAHRPRLTLDDGRELFFVTEETDIGEYGTSIQITKKPGAARS